MLSLLPTVKDREQGCRLEAHRLINGMDELERKGLNPIFDIDRYYRTNKAASEVKDSSDTKLF